MRDWEGTIVGRATPLGYGGVSIVRVSGRDAFAIVDRFVRVDGRSIRDVPARYMAPVAVVVDGSVWDRGLAVRFESPRSFTGEDVVELHLHGNPLIVDRVVDVAVASGARIALAGEFTMRAVASGKLDLVQAEAVAEAIAAESDDAVRIAQRQLGGELSARLRTLRQRVIDAIARLELELDFSEEGYSFLSVEEIAALVGDLRAEVDGLLRNFRSGRRFRTGPRVVLLGRPNAGKSSFFNAVLGYGRSLVSDVAGTTRDYIEERVAHDGLVLHIVDSAGLREAAGELESEGMRRAMALAQEADVVLYLVDAEDEDAARASEQEIRGFPSDVPVIRVWTKADRGVSFAAPLELSMSVLDSESIRLVLSAVVETYRPRISEITALVTERQARLLEEIRLVVDAIDIAREVELVSADLRAALEPLSGLVGESGNEDVLDAVFGSFCIGK